MDASFKINKDLAELDTLRTRLQALQGAWSLTSKTVTEINLVLEEIVVNIVEHGDKTNRHPIDISLQIEGQELTMVVTDKGPAFDPTLCAVPDTTLPLQKRQCGGLGIHLVRKLCSCCSYTRVDGCNIFTVKKNLHGGCR